jgi:hypothetical protein
MLETGSSQIVTETPPQPPPCGRPAGVGVQISQIRKAADPPELNPAGAPIGGSACRYQDFREKSTTQQSQIRARRAACLCIAMLGVDVLI